MHYYNTMGLKTMGFPKTRSIYKKRGFDPAPKPLRLFRRITSTYNLLTKATKVPKFEDPKGLSPNRPLRLTCVPSQDTLLLRMLGEEAVLLVQLAKKIFSSFLFLDNFLQCCF